MACSLDDASSQYLYANQAPVTGPPFTMACWFKSDDAAAVQCLMFVGDKDAGNQYHNLIAHGGVSGDPIYVQSRDSSGTASAETTSGYSLDTWHHACAVFAAHNDRSAFIDGGSKGTDSNSKSPSGLDRIAIGALARDVTTFYTSGEIAEAAIWNVALTDAEVAILAKGFSPLLVRQHNLEAYWSLVREAEYENGNIDRIKKHNLTDYGNPTDAAHCRIIYPIPPHVLTTAGIGMTPRLLRAIEKY
jgi:hypothetical protein